MVMSTGTTGWWEWLKILDGKAENMYGSETEFPLNVDGNYKEGEYKFYLDNTTDKAKKDLVLRIVADLISIAGLSDGNATIKGMLYNQMISGSSFLLNPNSYNDPGAIMNYMGNRLIEMATVEGERKALYQILGKTLFFYNAVKGAYGYIQRVVLYGTSPHFLEFKVCLYNHNVTACEEVILHVSKGDAQEGEANKVLPQPLVVVEEYADGMKLANSPNRVSFQVVSGGGHVTEVLVPADYDSQTAQTYWVLGPSGEQKVRAVVVNAVSGAEVSNEVFFTATIKDESQTDNIPSNTVDLGLSVLWATCNLGASKPTESGGYYAWGETTPKTFFSPENLQRIADIKNYFIFRDINNFSGTEYDAAYVTLGDPWRMPTKEDFKELIQNCTRETNVEIDGIKGDRYTASNGNSIFFPYAGAYAENPNKDYEIELWSINSTGAYWSSSYGGDGFGTSPRFFESWNGWGNLIVANQGWEGYNIRPVCPKP